MHVSLAEALEVRGGPLQEEELWAVLNQSAESLQELFRKVSIADPAALGFIISPWSLLLLPSGSVSFTDENISNQDLRAFTAPEVLQNQSLTSLSDVEKIHIYSLGMTLYWGADHEVPQSQPIKLGDHLNSILLGMCEDVIYARVSVRTVLDACSAHIRNSNCAPSFSYVKQLVKLVLGNLSGTDQLARNSEQKPDRSQAIRDRLRGKGLPTETHKMRKIISRTFHQIIILDTKIVRIPAPLTSSKLAAREKKLLLALTCFPRRRFGLHPWTCFAQLTETSLLGRLAGMNTVSLRQ
uniref:Protein tyrosine phosphatase non-receptor type 13 n=1 Tax=Equus asinus TaxID=9793 RepID=A0A9L0K399_EQUAS